MSRADRLAAGLGIALLLFYLATTTGIVGDTSKVTLALAFAIGPVAIVGIHRLAGSLSGGGDGASLRMARLFLVTAFVLFTVMIVVQQMIGLQFRGFLAAAPDVASAQALRTVFKGVNLVQLALDAAFDIFYCIGVVTLATVLYRHPGFGRPIGALGVASGAALLVFNLVAFPLVPAEAGLVDLGPVTGVWWLLVIARQVRLKRQRPPALRAA